jgi:hypothetical protein
MSTGRRWPRFRDDAINQGTARRPEIREAPFGIPAQVTHSGRAEPRGAGRGMRKSAEASWLGGRRDETKDRRGSEASWR